MQICLIRPPIIVPRRNQTLAFTPPLGIAYLAGSLVDAGFAVTVIDAVGLALDSRHAVANDCYLYGLTLDQVVDRIPENATIIGVSAGFSLEWPACVELLVKIRERFPDRLLVAGGEHLTALPERSLAETPLDVGILGEGEETLVDLARCHGEGRSALEAIPGITYKDADGEIRLNERRSRIRAIDDIPWPAWNLVPVGEYLDRGFGFGVNRGRSMAVLASRGCPYQCTFCSSPLMWTTRWLARDPDKLLDELEHYQKVYGATNFDFYDLTAIVKKSWIVALCEKIEQRGMTFTWQLPTGTRSEAIDAEVTRLLWRSGCRNISYSPESGSPSVLKRIKKKIRPDRMIASMAASVATGLNVKANIILGFPGETHREVFQTYGFLIHMALAGVHDVSVWAFSPYPGSELFAQLQEQGRLSVDARYFDSLRSYTDTSSTRSYSEHLGDRRLKLLRHIGMALFYLTSWLRRPSRPFRVIRNLVRGTHESRGEMVLASYLRRMRMPRSA